MSRKSKPIPIPMTEAERIERQDEEERLAAEKQYYDKKTWKMYLRIKNGQEEHEKRARVAAAQQAAALRAAAREAAAREAAAREAAARKAAAKKAAAKKSSSKKSSSKK